MSESLTVCENKKNNNACLTKIFPFVESNWIPRKFTFSYKVYLSNGFPWINDSFITISEIIIDFKFNIESNASHMWMILPKFILYSFL